MNALPEITELRAGGQFAAATLLDHGKASDQWYERIVQEHGIMAVPPGQSPTFYLLRWYQLAQQKREEAEALRQRLDALRVKPQSQGKVQRVKLGDMVSNHLRQKTEPAASQQSAGNHPKDI